MDRFKPPRSSPPVSRLNRILQEASDVSSSSEALAAELAELSPEEISLIDAIIARAGPSATTFLTIFKAYSEILAERGLEDANETVCYGKLLKLGTLKGRTWSEKWDKVKSQRPSAYPRTRSHIQPPRRMPISDVPKGSISDIFNPTEIESSTDFAESTPRLQTRTSRVTTRPPPQPAIPASRYQRPTYTPCLTPSTAASTTTSRARPPSPSRTRTTARPVAETPKPSKIKEAEAWKRIQSERDQENALLFYQDKLIERFWNMWREGHQWITTTGQQVSEARERLLLEKHLQRWRDKFTLQQKLAGRADRFVLLQSMKRWRRAWEEVQIRKRRHEIRMEMRQSMKTVRDKWQARILRDAWKRWRQANQLVLLSDRCNRIMARRFYIAWKSRWLRIRDTSARADEMLHEQSLKILVRAWQQWQNVGELRSLETTMRTRVELRIMDNTMTEWRRHLRNHIMAGQFRDIMLKKSTVSRWRNAVQRVGAMEHRADRQLAKSDTVFLYALMKVWKDKKNSRLLERERLIGVRRSCLKLWKQKLLDHKADYALADRFHQRPGSAIVKVSLGKWKAEYHQVQSVLHMADALYNGNIAAKALLRWRKSLRNKLKMIKMARAANKYFLLRRTYVRWREQADEKHRERVLQTYLINLQSRKFRTWLLKTRVRRSRATTLQALLHQKDRRIVHNALSRWVQRTVDIKEREFQITQQTRMICLISTFDKWKKFHKRRAEQKSLLENYMLVRREEMLSRVFGRWVALTRLARSRRQVLKESEDEVRLRTLEKFWEIWREKRLKDSEDEFLLRWNSSVARNLFRRWYSKTKAPPAIQFHAVRMKRGYIELWKRAMERAAQAKEARNFHRNHSIEIHFTKWLEAYKVKKMRKAIARARHLRLPAAAPKTLQHPVPTQLYPRRNSFLDAPPRAGKIEDAIPAPSVISSTYVGGPSASISVKSSSPRPSFARLNRDRSPFRGEPSALSRAKSEDGSAAPFIRKAVSSVTSVDAPVSRRAWPDLSRKSRLYLAPK